MPKRSLILKLIVRRDNSEKSIALRRALWDTHKVTNQMVAAYEQLLLEMRQGDVCLKRLDGKEEIRPAKVWREDLVMRLRSRGVKRRDEKAALGDLKILYRLIVRSHDTPGTGTANDSRPYHSPLCDRKSEGGIKKLKALDDWQRLIHSKKSDNWLRSDAEQAIEENPELLYPTGSPPGWIHAYRAGNADWFDRLQQYLSDLEEYSQGDNAAVFRLKGIGALPIMESFSSQIIRNQRSVLSNLERMALALAVAHLNSWESWGHRVREEHQKLDEKYNVMLKQGTQYCKAVKRLRCFEANREQDLKKNVMWTEQSEYRITRRETRGWESFRKWVLAHPEAGDDECLDRVRKMQTENPARFGGAEVMQWLAQNAKHLVMEGAGDPVAWMVATNSVERRLKNSRQLPSFTFANGVHHSRDVAFDPPANSNSPPYEIIQDEKGKLSVRLSLLLNQDDGTYIAEPVIFKLSPSKQAKGVKLLETQQDKKRVQYLEMKTQDGLDRHIGQVGGASLILGRDTLVDADASPGCSIGKVYLKIGLDMSVEREALQRRRSLGFYLSSALVTRPGSKQQMPQPGTRVLAVQIGTQEAAACSVFELISKKDPKYKQRWSNVQIGDLYLCHERSFLRRLPGEGSSFSVHRWAERRQIRILESLIRLLGDIRKLIDEEDPEKRIAQLGKMENRLRLISSDVDLDLLDFEKLSKHVHEPRDKWQRRVRPWFDDLEQYTGICIGQWREQHKKDEKENRIHGGLSLWRIDYLEAKLRLLKSWDRHPRPGQSIGRFDRAKQGIFARNLQEHINNIKKDRVKTTADLIVQAARGVTKLKKHGKWEKSHKPVDIIVLNDLSQYRARAELTRKENRRLLQWNHRSIALEVALQAEIESIAVAESHLGVFSRFDAKTGTPGVLCHAVTKFDVEALKDGTENYWLRKALGHKGLGLSQQTLSSLKPGDVLPIGQGDILISLFNGSLRKCHSRINGAMNLAVLFTTGYAEPVCVVAYEQRQVDGAPRILANGSIGKMLQGPLGGAAVLFEQVDDEEDFFHLSAFKTPNAMGRVLKKRNIGSGFLSLPAPDDDDNEVTEDDLETEGLTRIGKKVLFRDCSGQFFPPNVWVDGGRFWRDVQAEVLVHLRRSKWQA